MEYNFSRMEWWKSPNSEYLGDAIVGFCKDNSIYLTFDVRKGESGIKPTFSPICKVGSKNGHRYESYKHYRELFETLDGYSIYPIDKCNIYTLGSDKVLRYENGMVFEN